MARITWIQEGARIPGASFEFEMKNGFEPGRGGITLVPGGSETIAGKGSVEIEVEFETGVPSAGATVSGLYVESYATKIDDSGARVVEAKLADRRALWSRFGGITLEANVHDKGGAWKPSSLKNGRPWTWQELVLEVVDALGESANIVDAGSLPDNPYRPVNVKWVARPAVAALAELCEFAGYTVAMRYDGKISVVKKGEGAPPSVDGRYGPNAEAGKTFPRVPASAVITGARILDQRTVELEAAALDTADGEVKALAEVSYLQGIDVGRGVANGFAEITDKSAREAALATVGRLWRIPGTGKYADEGYGASSFMLPALDVTAEPSKGGGFKRARLEGAYFERGSENPPGKRGYRNVGADGAIANFAPGWCMVDSNRGLVRTSRVSGTLSETEIEALPIIKDGSPVRVELVPPRLTFAYLSNERYERRASCGTVTSQEGELSIRREDFFLWSVEGRPDAARKAALDRAADGLLEAALSRGVDAPAETGVYAGAHEIACNGLVSRVAWEADASGGTTTFEKNLRGFEDLEMPGIRGMAEFGISEDYEPPAKASHGSPALEAENLRLANVNKRGPIPIRESDELSEKNREAGRADDDECAVFAELSDFDHDSGEPELDKVGPAEAENWNYRDHTPAGDAGKRAQDRVWATRLISDDKYAEEENVNRSTEVVRLCDGETGDLDEFVRVRASDASGAFRAMLHLDKGGDSTTPEFSDAGYITDVPLGLGRRKFDPESAVSPVGRVSQWGWILMLTDDDAYAVTRDGDKLTLPNIFHKAHFHYDEGHDGRIYFTTTDISGGVEPTAGIMVKGEMSCDSDKANANTYLAVQKETGEWRPWFRQLNGEYVYYAESFPAAGETAPADSYEGGFKSWNFGAGGDTAESFSFPLPEVPAGFQLTVELFYSTFTGSTGADTVNVEFSHRLVASGESLSSGGSSGSSNVQIQAAVTAGELGVNRSYAIPAVDVGDAGEMAVLTVKRTPGSNGDDHTGGFEVVGLRLKMEEEIGIS